MILFINSIYKKKYIKIVLIKNGDFMQFVYNLHAIVVNNKRKYTCWSIMQKDGVYIFKKMFNKL